ncbi:uncharacterized protein G2W53_008591 [Senna tora]|uniref:Uncharacterized protein n=1 Tax=Senna tora TaxID=362788 RepID=A0A834X9S6_9FABA|nr:uncharacterized protein G2W53_008591 [Senna tora]
MEFKERGAISGGELYISGRETIGSRNVNGIRKSDGSRGKKLKERLKEWMKERRNTWKNEK